MKPIRVSTIGKIIKFFVFLIIVLLIFFLISLFKKNEPVKVDKVTIVDSNKVIDYTFDRVYEYDFDNEGFKNDKDEITIKKSGTYKLKGKNEKYKIIIDSPNSVVKIVLSNFESTIVYDLIDIKAAKKVIIELEDNTKNSITSDLLEQEGIDNPVIIKSEADIEITGNGSLIIETIGTFIESNGNVDFKNATLEINSINKGLDIKGNFKIDSGNFYIMALEKGVYLKGNITINNGTFIIRADSTIENSGLFIINGGKVYLAGLNEIKKPNANSLQKTLILNFKEKRDKLLFFHDNTKVNLVYAGGMEYQHILYSDDFKSDSYILYGGGKVSGSQQYGLYIIDDTAEDDQLMCAGLTNDRFVIKDLVNIYDDIVKK